MHANSEEKELLSTYLLELLALDTHEEDSLNGTVEGMIAARVERRASGQVASISLSESNALLRESGIFFLFPGASESRCRLSFLSASSESQRVAEIDQS
jgi:hypothetical protein